jgi:uncharacterized membrane protein YdcZ (DUF606 family)
MSHTLKGLEKLWVRYGKYMGHIWDIFGFFLNRHAFPAEKVKGVNRVLCGWKAVSG